MKTPASYLDSLGETYEPFDCTSFTCIEVLPFLRGKPWDWIALAYVHALRPSTIRVTDGGLKANARLWRVTVYLKEGTRLIDSIEQEVEVGLPEGISNGHGLDIALEHGRDSIQSRRENGV